MSNTYHPKDGLLLLLQAAKKLDEESIIRYTNHSEKWEHRLSQRNNYDNHHNPYSCSNNYGTQRKPVMTVRCTHNELEKSRRAHLRTCMETLKEHLNFDNDVPRITMLTVLKKATATIQYLKQKNQCLESCEDSEKQRWAQLLKRRQTLRKKLEEKRNRSLKLQNWKERNRNCSECSIATTSSDDSEIDPRFASQSKITPTQLSGIGTQLLNTAASGLNACVNDQNYTIHVTKCAKSGSPNGSSPIGLDAFDASSSDSGFEEITITSSGIMSPNESSINFCVNEGSQCASYVNEICRAY